MAQVSSKIGETRLILGHLGGQRFRAPDRTTRPISGEDSVPRVWKEQANKVPYMRVRSFSSEDREKCDSLLHRPIPFFSVAFVNGLHFPSWPRIAPALLRFLSGTGLPVTRCESSSWICILGCGHVKKRRVRWMTRKTVRQPSRQA